jgi:hypothetical protein
MPGVTAVQLPFPHELAREFVVCDRWFSSHPGHTRPFVRAATSGGTDMRPSWWQIFHWSVNHWAGLELAHGTIYHRLEDAGLGNQLYAGDGYPTAQTRRNQLHRRPSLHRASLRRSPERRASRNGGPIAGSMARRRSLAGGYAC